MELSNRRMPAIVFLGGFALQFLGAMRFRVDSRSREAMKKIEHIYMDSNFDFRIRWPFARLLFRHSSQFLLAPITCSPGGSSFYRCKCERDYHGLSAEAGWGKRRQPTHENKLDIF